MSRNFFRNQIVCLSILAAIGLSSAKVSGQAFTDPEKAGEEFELQGEYVGTLQSDAGEVKVGVQVIALGEGKFQVVGYKSGLPGDGWDGEEPERADGSLENGKVVFTGEHATATLADGMVKITGPDNMQLGELSKVLRTSPTLGKAPPEGAVVLFDGTSAENFVSPRGGPAKMTDDGLLMQGANSKQLFGDCHLHLEFRLPFQPAARGQGRGNSGMYLQARYEVQMLDSFGLSGEHNECGGLYSIKKPNVNMCFPPLSWQTYDVDFVAARYDESGKKVSNARITVKHNGVLVHDDVELPKTTTGAPLKDTIEKGFLHLQDHGNPVLYRNIWLVEK